MLLTLFLALFFIACFRGLTRDDGAVSFIVLIGFLQDPARKLVEGEPVLMTVMVAMVAGCITLRRVLVSVPLFIEPFRRWSMELSLPLSLYLCLVAAQGVHSLVRYQSAILTALGAIFYLAPLIAIMVGYSQFHRFELVRWFLVSFCAMAIVVALSVFVSFSGVESNLLKEVGSGLIIYDQGTVLQAYSGLMRSSEIAAWHMGACVCFLVILMADRGSLLVVSVSSLLVGLLIAAIVLTGRRKMILQIAIFISLYFPLLQFYQRRLDTRFVVIFGAIAMSLIIFVYWFTPSLSGTSYDLYFARGATVFGDAGERFTGLGLNSINWAYRRFGFFGGGLGVATQGAQHLASGMINGAGEGGLGKLVSELGLISLLIIPMLAYVCAKHLHRCMRLVSAVAPKRLALVVGIATFLIANVPTFIVASQAYGDVFVLLILGLLTGALFAQPIQVMSKLSSMQNGLEPNNRLNRKPS